MKTIAFFLSFLLSGFIFAQNQADNWYFGQNAGVNFGTGVPIALTDGQLSTNEGCATISDDTGQLLFYTDGITVWDKTHNVMPNGTGLLGDPSSSQSGIIVPFPNNSDQYYIFTVGANETHPPFGNLTSPQLNYSIVDVTLNSGNGDIVNGFKNVPLLNLSAEKIAAVSDGSNGFWVLTFAGFNGTEEVYDTVHAFRVTNTGIQPAVKTTLVTPMTNDGRGYLKISPDGTKVILCNQDATQNFVCLYDFDDTTGIVSAETILNTNTNPYCAEFSGTSEKLYVSTGEFLSSTAELYQFDLNSLDINNSRILINSSASERGAIQLAKDGKIYYARPGQSFLGVINDPENIGTAVNYVDNGVSLSGKICRQGLPPFIQSFFITNIGVQNNCLGEITQFTLNVNGTSPVASVTWDFGDGNGSNLENPTHIYAALSTYNVNVNVFFTDGSSQSVQSIVEIFENPVANSVTDFLLCDDVSNDGIETFDLSTKTPEILGSQSSVIFEVNYYENQNDALNRENELPLSYQNSSLTETIFVRIDNSLNSNCFDITSFDIILNFQPTANTIDDVFICDDPTNDQSEPIIFSDFNATVLDNQDSNEFSVSYHLSQNDADLNINSLPDNFENMTNPQTFFVRIENNQNTDCYDTSSFTVTIDRNFTAVKPDDLFLCDDTSNDGNETFDLSLTRNQISNWLVTGNIVTYHLTQEDANNGVNPLSENYTNETNPQEIFARIENEFNSNCFDTTSFSIEVLEIPNIIEQETYILCRGETLELLAESGFDRYNWSTGQTTRTITVSEAGTYIVEIIKDYQTIPQVTSCSNVKTIIVVESDKATIDEVITTDWTATNNTITVMANGIGDYEYSIDGISYQDDNLFTGLGTGEFTVYVRDKLGCGVVSETVYLLYYMRFFTPNNDGHNDFWQIIASDTEPDLEIIILDRYGKLLGTLNPLDVGWNGTYMGNNMPATDYWFIVRRPSNERTYKGHFALVR